MAKVVVGLSGGVDSSVSAYLLQQQGYEVIGIFMRNWVDDSVIISEDCPWIEDSNDALLVAEKLGIPFQTIDFSAEYKERIVDYMFQEYEAGRTPNPDILCNREVKFDLFLKKALELGADYVATGHYCRKGIIQQDGKEIYQLLSGKDSGKDQSYFLCQVSQQQLSKALFPIGELQKSEVRKIAKQLDLITAEKKDSQGLCFIGKVRLPDFLQQQLKPKKGNIVEVPETHEIFTRNWQSNDLNELSKPFEYQKDIGKVVGQHQGAHYFTIGQRKGMNVGGTPLPLFVIHTDTKENIIYVGQGDNHPGLHRKALFVPAKDIHWIREDLALKEGESKDFKARIRYRQPLENCTLHRVEHGLYIVFNQMQRGVTPGQFVAWYQDDELLGSGVIQ
jgi:tRNA-uridine 2-sulfurtransferase